MFRTLWFLVLVSLDSSVRSKLALFDFQLPTKVSNNLSRSEVENLFGTFQVETSPEKIKFQFLLTKCSGVQAAFRNKDYKKYFCPHSLFLCWAWQRLRRECDVIWGECQPFPSQIFEDRSKLSSKFWSFRNFNIFEMLELGSLYKWRLNSIEFYSRSIGCCTTCSKLSNIIRENRRMLFAKPPLHYTLWPLNQLSTAVDPVHGKRTTTTRYFCLLTSFQILKFP